MSEEAAAEERRIPFGWCLDGHHRQCLVTVGKLTCPCTSCGDEHGVDPAPVPGPSESMKALIAKYSSAS